MPQKITGMIYLIPVTYWMESA